MVGKERYFKSWGKYTHLLCIISNSAGRVKAPYSTVCTGPETLYFRNHFDRA